MAGEEGRSEASADVRGARWTHSGPSKHARRLRQLGRRPSGYIAPCRGKETCPDLFAGDSATQRAGTPHRDSLHLARVIRRLAILHWSERVGPGAWGLPLFVEKAPLHPAVRPAALLETHLILMNGDRAAAGRMISSEPPNEGNKDQRCKWHASCRVCNTLSKRLHRWGAREGSGTAERTTSACSPLVCRWIACLADPAGPDFRLDPHSLLSPSSPSWRASSPAASGLAEGRLSGAPHPRTSPRHPTLGRPAYARGLAAVKI